MERLFSIGIAVVVLCQALHLGPSLCSDSRSTINSDPEPEIPSKKPVLQGLIHLDLKLILEVEAPQSHERWKERREASSKHGHELMGEG